MSEQSAKTQWSIEWWKGRHDRTYFPVMKQHKNWAIYEEMRPWFLENARPTKEDTALEIGCGYGEWMIPLSRLVKTVDGFDIHELLVRKAEEKFKEYGVDNATMVLGNGFDIPYPDNRFSLVYSISVFQHMPRDTVVRYMEETVRVLQPKGRFFHYFRFANGIGPYSDDIEVEHTGDFSVGWTEEEVKELARPHPVSFHIENMGDVVLLLGAKE